jgi:flagellar motor switch protein FliG
LTDLARLDESTLANLVTRADPWLFALALAGAEPSVARRWMERLGPTSARDIQRQLTQLGPWRLSDAVEAEKRLVRLARELVIEATTPSPKEI